MPACAVVFTADHRPEMEAFAPVLADILGLSLIDARLRIRKGRGVFLENLDEATARRVADALGGHGAPAEVVPMERIVRLPSRPTRLFQADCRPDGLHYKRNIDEAFRVVPWDDVRFVHSGIVATPHYRDFVQSKTFQLLPAMHRIDDAEAREQLKRHLARKALRREVDAETPPPEERRRLSPEEIQELCRNQTDGYLDLFVETRPDAARAASSAPVRGARAGFLRADRREVQLDYLGPRAEGSSLDNFKRLVADVVSRAARAHVTAVTRRLLDGGDLQPLVFDDLAEYERYACWVCLREGIAPPIHVKITEPADLAAAPEGTEVTACARCGTVIPAESERCPFCMSRPGQGRRRRFWWVFVPLVLLAGAALGGGFLYLESERREEAIRRVRLYEVPAPGSAARRTIEAAIQADPAMSGGGRRPIGWGATRRSEGEFEVEYVTVRTTYSDKGWETEKAVFRVNLETGRITAANALAQRFLR